MPVKRGLTDFWVIFFKWPNWKRVTRIHIPSACRGYHWWHAAPQDRALLLFFSLVLHLKYRQMSQDSARADRWCRVSPKVSPRLGCSNCLNVYYASRDSLWASASTCVQLHEHRYRQGGPGVLHQETTQFGIWILNTRTQTFLDPSAYPSDSSRKLFLPGLHAQKSSGVEIAPLSVHSALHFIMPLWNSLRKMIVT